MENIEEQFNLAVINSKKLTKLPDNEVLLRLYALYKQGSEGNVKGERPGGFDFKGAAKFDAWESEKDNSQEEAMQEYINTIDDLLKKES